MIVRQARNAGLALSAAAGVLCLAACSREARVLGPTPPQTAPDGPADPRITSYQGNAYQIAQGGRYFGWYGCGVCHKDDARGVLNLADGQWRRGGGFDRVYGTIAHAHREDYGARVPIEQLWQITAFVRDLPTHTPDKRRRQAIDQSAEAQGPVWKGPLR